MNQADTAIHAEAEVALRRQHALAALIERYCGNDGVFQTDIPRVSFYRASSTSAPVCGVYRPVLALIAQGAKRVSLGDEVYEYGEGRCLVTSVDLPVLAQVTRATRSRPILGMVLELEPRRIADLMGEMATPRPSAAVARGLAVEPVTPPLMDAVLRLARLLDAPQDLPVLAPLFEREVIYRLLCGPQGPRLRDIAVADSQSQRIAGAIDWLKRNYTQTLSIDQLAQTANMSKSSLHQHFKAMTAMTPLQYQKQIRLQEARRLMLIETLDAASAGHRVGYESASQFNREYRRLFGAPPMKDIARLRQAE